MPQSPRRDLDPEKVLETKTDLQHGDSDPPVEVGGLRVVDVLALLGHGGRVRTLAVRGLQRVTVALQVNVAHGQRHVIGPGHLDVALSRLGAALVGVHMFAHSGRGGHVRHLDVRDAALPDDEL